MAATAPDARRSRGTRNRSVDHHDQMTRKIHRRSNVSRTESTNEPRQPSRLEKKRNTHAGCPAGHGPTRGVSGVSGSTTLFHKLAQTRRELLAAVHDRR